MTQKQKILQALREAKEEGINSYIARDVLQIIQLPTRIFELKELGYNIVEKTNPNRSVNYILLGEPKRFKPVEIKQVEKEVEYVFIGNVGYRKEDLKPEQQSLI